MTAVDRESIKNAQEDIENFDKIYIEYAEKIKNYLRRKVSNDDFVAEDLTSQTFEKALRNIKGFQWKGVSFSAWLYTIANNTLIDFYRKHKNTADITPEHFENLKDPADLTEDVIIEKDTGDRIKQVLDQLNGREREIINLKFYDGLSNKEIAEKLNISETNVSTIIYRTVKKLKDLISDGNIEV